MENSVDEEGTLDNGNVANDACIAFVKELDPNVFLSFLKVTEARLLVFQFFIVMTEALLPEPT